jgi:hypothetical protein
MTDMMSEDTATNTGWIMFIASLGMMAGLMGNELMGLQSWEQVRTIAFFGKSLVHFSIVVAAFVGGRLIPTGRDQRGRSTDTMSASWSAKKEQ